MSNVWIIVPIYKGGEDIPDFCASLKATTPDDAYSLVAIDDCCPERSSELLHAAMPEAVVLHNEKNSGFAVACNKGMRYAMEQGAKYVMVANQDLRFLPNWLDPLIHLLENDSAIAAVQPKILMYPDMSLINSCGNELHILGFGYTRGYLKKESEYACASVADMAYCSGAAAIYRAAALNIIGPYDEKLFMYHEDSDLCMRFRLAGYRNVVCPLSHVAHRYEFSRSIKKFYHIERNRFIIMLKHYRLKTLALLFPLFVFWECGMLAYGATQFFIKNRTVNFFEKIKGYLFFLHPSTWKYIAQERKKSAALRILSDKEFFKLFTTEIAFQDVDNPLIRCIANPITRAYWRIIRNFIV